MKAIQDTELIITENKKIYHLNLDKKQIADDIILVGDQSRVSQISKHFDKITDKIQHREFVTHTGFYKGKNITALSTGIGCDNIDIVIHPESIIHSMVEFIDGSIKAQLSHPTMEIPIQFAFTYPNRLNNNITFDFTKQKKFTFEEVDYNKFRCIKLAYQAGRESGTYPAVLNVSNDIAVDMFLNDRINFNEIPIIVEECLNNHNSINSPDINDIKNTILLTEEYIANLNLIKT